MDALEADDNDAAVAYSVQMAAGVGLAAASLGEASTAEAALLFDLGPWGWAFLTVVVVAGLIAAALTDTEIEKWAKQGPFSNDLGERCTHEYQDKTPAEIQQSLMTLLMAPRVLIKTDPAASQPSVIVDVHAPGFTPGRSILDARATVQRSNPGPYQTAVWDTDQEPLRCVSWMPLLADTENPASEVGLRYRYLLPTDAIGPVRVRARARHITAEQLIIPTWPDKPPANTDDPIVIDPELNGWAYAGPLTVNQ